MALFSEILSRLVNRIFPASGSTGQVGVKQGDGSIAFSDLKTVGGNSILGSGDIAAGSPYAVASGVNTYAVTIAGITAYSEGASFLIKFTNANTGASSLNINSLGAKNIYANVSTALTSGVIAAGMILELYYDGTNFQINKRPDLPSTSSIEKALSVDSSGVKATYDIVSPSVVDINDLQSAAWTSNECTGVTGYYGQYASDSDYVYCCVDAVLGKWSRFPRTFPTVASGEKAISITSAGIQKTYDIKEADTANVSALQSATWAVDNTTTGITGYYMQPANDSNYFYFCIDPSNGKWLRVENNKRTLEKRLGEMDDSGGTLTNTDLETEYPSAVIGQEVKGAVSAGKFKLYTKEASGTWTFVEHTNC